MIRSPFIAMATLSAKNGLAILSILLVVLVAQKTEAMNVVLTNNMNQEVGVTCGFEGSVEDFGSHILLQGQSYAFQVGNGGADFTGLRYSCTFASMGKPSTVLEVFSDTGGAGNGPCQCTGAVCPWSISFGGFSCNGGGFSHGWES